MTVHTREELDRLSRLARKEFSSGLMSDTKWRKLFHALATSRSSECQIFVKFLDEPQVRSMASPSVGAMWPPHPYIDSKFGPIELRAIEWVDIPYIVKVPRGRNLPHREVTQDFAFIQELLRKLGQFPILETEDGIRIEGYRR